MTRVTCVTCVTCLTSAAHVTCVIGVTCVARVTCACVSPHSPCPGFMAMLCYANGSLVRERVRDTTVGPDWGRFSAALRSTPPGNDGHIGAGVQLPPPPKWC